MAVCTALELMQFMKSCSITRKCRAFLEFKRFYARGSRYLPPANMDSSIGDKEETKDQKLSEFVEPHQRKILPRTFSESPKELLENAASFREGSPRNKPKERVEDIWDSDPYPKDSNWKQSQAKFSMRPKCDPRQTSIILFPGQGCFVVFQYFLL